MIQKNDDKMMSLEEARDIGLEGVKCKKTGQYYLAKLYFSQASQRMIDLGIGEKKIFHSLVRSGQIKEDQKQRVQGIIASFVEEAEKCSKAFNEQIEELKKDQYCKEILPSLISGQNNGASFQKIGTARIKNNFLVGLENAKQALFEALIFPSKRPDLFTGLRSPPKGILFYGPPGNGKTFLAKAVANECQSNFFAISASNMVSKWVGDSEKLMKALMQVARVFQPSVIFIDEVDSILSERSEKDSDSSKRLKTEFLVQFDGVTSSSTERITIIGATNLPNNLDPAALRRFGKRIYIPLPSLEARYQMLDQLLSTEKYEVSKKDLQKFAKELDYYSASDISNLVKEAAMGPLRGFGNNTMMVISKYHVRAINIDDLVAAKKSIPPSVQKKDITFYETWEKKFTKAEK